MTYYETVFDIKRDVFRYKYIGAVYNEIEQYPELAWVEKSCLASDKSKLK